MKIKILAALLTVSFCFTGMVSAKGSDYTMIVSPARFSVLQVMFDVINKRSSVLVSYQDAADENGPLLHVWNGSAWTQIGLHDLGEMSFVEKTPTRVVMIGDDSLLPQEVKDSLSWLPEVIVIRHLDNANLLNEFGRIMEWSGREWSWFAARYNLQVEDEAAAIRKSSWYDQSGPLIKQDQPIYEPVPVVNDADTINPSSTTLPSPEASLRPSDLPVSDADNEIQEIVDTLEENVP